VATIRAASAWGLTAVLVRVFTAFLVAVTAAQLTAPGDGKRVLRRSVAVMTDIDNTLPQIESDLHATASGADTPTVQVPDFPIAVYVSRVDGQTLTGPALREVLLDEGADRLYDDGSAAWSSGDPDAQRSVPRASAAGLIDRGLGTVRDTTHVAFVVLAVFLALVTAAMVVVLMIALPRDARLIALGGSALAASLPLLAAAVALRFAFRTAGPDSDPFVQGLLDIGSDSMWVPVRNCFTAALLGAGLLASGLALVWWEARRLGDGGRLADTRS
jgi:hypothetical protein